MEELIAVIKKDLSKHGKIKAIKNVISIIFVIAGLMLAVSPFFMSSKINLDSPNKQMYGLTLLGTYALGVLLMTIGIVSFIIVRMKHKQRLKKIYMDRIVEYNFEESKYAVGGSSLSGKYVPFWGSWMLLKSIAKSDLSAFHGDYIIGGYLDVEFQHLISATSDLNSKALSGRFIQWDYFKPVYSKHEIFERSESLKDVILNDVINVESIEFNKMFAIRSEDRHELFYILTPDIIEKMIHFNKKHSFKIHYQFINSSMIVYSEDLKKPLTVCRNVEKTVHELQKRMDFIKEIVECFAYNH